MKAKWYLAANSPLKQAQGPMEEVPAATLAILLLRLRRLWQLSPTFRALLGSTLGDEAGETSPGPRA